MVKNCDTTLFWPDTVLLMKTMGIDVQIVSPSGFQVFQNNPNPTGEITSLRIFVPETGLVKTHILDVSGNTIISLNKLLEKGFHKFLFKPGNKQMYLFTAMYKSENRSVKIVVGTKLSLGECLLSYVGRENSEPLNKHIITSGNFQFSPGDSIKITGYYKDATSIFYDAPESNKNYTFLFSVFSCGTPITINHIMGAVCPVDKTVTYNTVTSIPGELTKCWIASNLGADHQATTMNDEAEASAGWYWQFNLKQGYKPDGSIVPPWTIFSINEPLNWEPANDPCSIELGSPWHIPTHAEWYNVDNAGGWTTWSDPWNSGLKLHPAGYISYDKGIFSGRGYWGRYWSNSRYDENLGWSLNFSSDYSKMYVNDKAFGFPTRCIRDN